MKTLFRAVTAAFVLSACVASGQTPFPAPDQNIWLVADKLQFGTVPVRALGTNAPGTPGYGLLTDGANLYWAPIAAQSGTTTNLTVNNFNVNIVSNYQDITFVTNVVINNNLTVQSNATFNSSVTIQTNLTVNQNFQLSGKATLQTIIITNTALFSTNAFPLSPGTTWNWSRYSQLLVTNADLNIGSISGISNNLLNMAELVISNSGAGNITANILFAGNKVGPQTTNAIVIPSGKEAYITAEARGFQRTNYCTQVEQ